MTASPYMPDVRVEVGWTSGVNTPLADVVWTDISDKVEFDYDITITRGRESEQATTSPSSCSIVLDNSDGRFTPGLSSSPYYPNVKLGRPIRVLINHIISGTHGTFDDTDLTNVSGTSCTVARVTSPVDAGAGALSLTATSATTIFANLSGTGTSADRVPAGVPITASVRMRRNGVTARNGRVDVVWYDAAGSTISTTTGSVVALTTSYQTVSVVDTSPATAVYARLRAAVVSAGNTEVFHIDEAKFQSARFTGYVDEWPIDWSDGTSTTAWARVIASSRSARIAEGAELRSVIETEIMADNPVAYYPMGESQEFGHLLDLTGNDTIGMYSYYGGDGITLAGATGPGTDGLSAPQIEPRQSGEQGDALAAYFSTSMTEVTLECFVRLPSRNTTDAVNVITLYQGFQSDDFRSLQFLATSGGVSSFFNSTYTEQIGGATSQLGAFTVYADPTNAVATWESMFANRTHHVAVTFEPGVSPTMKTYIDGALFNTNTGLSGPGPLMTTMPDWSLLVLGPYQTASGERPMVVAHAAVFDSILPDDRIQAHADAGLNGFAGELAEDRIARYASYGSIEAADIVSDTGVVPLGHVDTTGKTVDSLLRTIEATENGVLFDSRDGKLIFRDRDHRYLATSAFTLDVAQQQVESSLRPTLDRSGLINEVTSTSASDDTVAQRYSDATSRDDYGPKRQDVEVASTDLDVLLQSAAWRVNRYKDPRIRIPALAPVDVLTLPDATRYAVTAADISTMFTVSNLPAQAAASTADFFIEGVVETLALESWTFQFNVSPAEVWTQVWVLDSGTLSQLDSTTILAL